MSVIRAADIALDAPDLDPARAAQLLAARTRARDASEGDAQHGAPLLCWTLGGERFALPLGEVAQVLPLGRITRVPGTPPALLGLATRRGRLLNVVDPAAALGVRAGTDGEAHLIVLRGTQPRLALRVDRADGVAAAAADESAVESAEESGTTRQALLADGARVLLVDKRRLIGALGLGGQLKGM